jgi:tetratricopeptide (TPR) repeat protein
MSQKKKNYRQKISFLKPILIILFFFSVAMLSADAVDYFEEGLIAQMSDDFFRAIELYKSSLDINPNYIKPVIGLARCFYYVEQYDEALSYVTIARSQDRNNSDLKILEADIRISLGELDEARELLDDVLSYEPNNLNARLSLAQLNLADGKKRNAALEFLETLKISPYNVHALISLALLYEDLGEYDTSETYLNLALANYTDDPDVYYTAGRYYYKKKDYQDAVDYINTALTLKPSFNAAKQLLADIYIIQGKASAAIDLLRELLNSKNTEDVHNAWYSLGLAYKSINNYEDSLFSFYQAFQIKIDDEVSRIVAENFALENFMNTISWRKEYSLYHYDRGTRFERDNQLDKALPEYRRSLRLNPDSKDARFSYASVYRLLGYPIKYLMELLVLTKYYQYTDIEILDDIEIYERYIYDSIAFRWADIINPFRDKDDIFDQYSIDKNTYSLSFFTINPQNNMIHLLADNELTAYFKDLFFQFDNFEIMDTVSGVDDFNEAFSSAREAGSDYFIILRFDEETRTFSVRGDVYLTRSGSHLDYIRIYKTGNNRVSEALVRLSRRIIDLFPVKGTLIAREYNDGIVNMGRMQGISPDEVFLIIKNNGIELSMDSIALEYDEDDVLGRLTVTETDENLSLGIIETENFFDEINIGDELILLPQEEEEE